MRRGSPLFTQQAPLGQSVTVTLPAADGTYPIQAETDLGPYQGPVGGALSVTVADPSNYDLSVGQDILPPNTAVSITARLRKYGSPVAGAEIRLSDGYGTFTTDGDGLATLAFTTPSSDAYIDLVVTDGLFTAALDTLYVVRPGMGVLEIDSVLDEHGNPLNEFYASPYYFSPYSGWWVAGRTMTWDSHGSIQPAGTTYLEVTDDDHLYLIQRVHVPDQDRVAVSLSGAEARALSVSATLDGAPLSGTVSLHNEMMPGPTWRPRSLNASQVFVTPGIYTVLFQGPNLLLERSRVNLSENSSVTFRESSSNLATVQITAADGYGQPDMSLSPRTLPVGTPTPVTTSHFWPPITASRWMGPRSPSPWSER